MEDNEELFVKVFTRLGWTKVSMSSGSTSGMSMRQC